MSDGLNLSDALFGDSASSAPTVSNPAGPWNPNMGSSNVLPGFPAAGGQQPQPAMMNQLVSPIIYINSPLQFESQIRTLSCPELPGASEVCFFCTAHVPPPSRQQASPWSQPELTLMHPS
ncbi:UNVERIFIED_CONTAM: hypothetical protein FKN15_013777 [Acipenser sinensis]